MLSTLLSSPVQLLSLVQTAPLSLCLSVVDWPSTQVQTHFIHHNYGLLRSIDLMCGNAVETLHTASQVGALNQVCLPAAEPILTKQSQSNIRAQLQLAALPLSKHIISQHSLKLLLLLRSMDSLLETQRRFLKQSDLRVRSKLLSIIYSFTLRLNCKNYFTYVSFLIISYWMLLVPLLV